MRLDGKNLLIGTVLFGSLWGVFECTVGDYLHFSGLPAGIINVWILCIYTLDY